MRLGLDIGANSICWWLFEAKKGEIFKVVDGGVRIFSDGRDPKSGASLAVDRRAARAMRRRRDRYLRRRAALMRQLADAGLMPATPEQAKQLEALDPYALRARGLDEPLELIQFGRALFDLNQRRGFKSNRKTDRGDNESGKIKDAVARLDQAMMAKGARSYGEFLHLRRSSAADPRHTPSVRTRLTVARRDASEKEESGYDFYPDRQHLEQEFHKLWAVQRSHHSVLTDELRDILFETIFYQRPLKAPVVGLCLFTGEKRLAKAHPLTQRRILYETVNNLRVTADGREKRPLTRQERDTIVHALDNKKSTKSLSSMAMNLPALGKIIKLRGQERFTLETEARDSIACDPVRASLAHPDRFGPSWSCLDFEKQWEVISRIRSVESDTQFNHLVEWLSKAHGLEKSKAQAVANAPLPEGYSSLGEQATRQILSKLEADVVTYNRAVEACGWHHSNARTGECLDELPYYGSVLDRHVLPGSGEASHDDVTRFGRISNPTVHIGLNQLRRVVNEIITVYGKPDQIVVELARDLKQSERQRAGTQKRIKENTADAKRRSETLAELGVPDTGANRLKLRLYEELGPAIGPRLCPYSGQPISVTMVFDGSCDTDHILPYSRTLDDGMSNKTLCLKEANRAKTNKSPWEIWGDTHRWSAIEANLKNLPENKRWRFAPDAMERFEGDNSFLDRALTDTQYLSRIAWTYLDTLFTEGGHVWVVPGRLTEMLRRHWGLNSLLSDGKSAYKVKNCTDHRHHAIDAEVIAATDRSLVQRISKAAGRNEDSGAEDVARETAPPWEDFRADVVDVLDRMIVSHRADHGRIETNAKGSVSTTGQLHNDTAYGIVDDQQVVSRSPLLSLKPADISDNGKGKCIRDPQLRRALDIATKGKSGKAFEQALQEFAEKPGPYQGIRRVRLIEKLQKAARVEIADDTQSPYKAYKGDSNHCYELWRLPDGKVKAQVVTTFQAHNGEAPKPHPAAKRLVRVYKRDMVALQKDGETVICYVQKFRQNGTLFLTPHLEANADARDRDKGDPFKLIGMGPGPLAKASLRRVFVSEIGRVKDPGPAR